MGSQEEPEAGKKTRLMYNTKPGLCVHTHAYSSLDTTQEPSHFHSCGMTVHYIYYKSWRGGVRRGNVKGQLCSIWLEIHF